MADDQPTLRCGFTHWRGTPVFALPSIGEVLKRVLGAVFLQDRGIWVFPAYYPFTENVVQDLKIVAPHIEFSDEAQEHIEASRAVAEAVENNTQAYRDDFSFITKPFAHQEEALNFALNLLRCGIFYDMGLGKTKVVVDLLRHEREKALILSPTIGVRTWLEETATHSGGELKAVAVQGTPKKKRAAIEASVDADALVVSYDSAKRYFDEIVDTFKYRVIIADESHYLRGHRSARTKCAIALATRAYRRVILSGTPSLGNPLHLWGQLTFLGPHIPAKTFWHFRRQFTIHSPYNKRMITGFKNMEILNDKVSRVATRKKKEECLDLPERTIIDVPFEISGKQKKTYNELVGASVAELANGELFEAAHAAVVIQKLLQIMSGFFIIPPPNICDGCIHIAHCVENNIRPYRKDCRKETEAPPEKVEWFPSNPKLKACEEILDSVLAEETNKVIIWAHFTKELDTVEELLKKRDIGYTRVDGRNSSKAQDLANDFNTNPGTRVWLGQIKTGVAITLTAATYTIYYGLNYNLDEYLQSMDRNFRIGQGKPVFVYRMTCERSILEYVVAALEQKINIAETLTDRINCVLCDKGLMCVTKAIKPFEEGCKYKDRTKRVVTRPKKL